MTRRRRKLTLPRSGIAFFVGVGMLIFEGTARAEQHHDPTLIIAYILLALVPGAKVADGIFKQILETWMQEDDDDEPASKT